MISTMVVNAGNYIYNLMLGRILGPAEFAEAGLIVTTLLVFSFVGMAFQITTAKYVASLEHDQIKGLVQWLGRCSFYTGLLISLLLVLFSSSITDFFQLSNGLILPCFASFLPFYFLMSVERGALQGQQEYIKLSVSFQVEMWVRLVLTGILIFFIVHHVGMIVVVSIVVSISIGYYFTRSSRFTIFTNSTFEKEIKTGIVRFLLLTAAYEVTQIAINYADMLMVKHYFDNRTAGLYTSMALIGRMIYFVTWMVVMILIPAVLNKKKEGKPFKKLLLKYVFVISVLSSTLTLGCLVFPSLVVRILFGSEFMAISGLLWKYALATSLFAVANIFVYYFLSMDKFMAVYVSAIIAVIQITGFLQFHDSIEDIVMVQVVMMSVLLLFQVSYFIWEERHTLTNRNPLA